MTSSGYSPEERQALRNMLRDPAEVKDMFNLMSTRYQDALDKLEQFQKLQPKNDELESMILDFKSKVDLNDMLEVIVLNQIQQREELRRCIDAIISNNVDKLKELRQKMDS